MSAQPADAASGRRVMPRGGGSRREMSRRAALAVPLGALLAGCSTGLGSQRRVAPPRASPGTAASGDTLARTLAHAPVRFGVNYTPSHVWWDLWQSFDSGRVDADFAAIAALGVDHIRVQLLWSVFQPTPARADPGQLANLEKMFDLADRHGLDVCTSVVTAALSGLHFIPAWANGRDWVQRPELIDAQVNYIRDVGRAVGAHHRLLGFDLGNEDLGHAPDRSESHLRNWATQLIRACDSAAPGKVHTVSPNGLFAVPYPNIVATVGAVSAIHPWCFLPGTIDHAGRLAPSPGRHAEYNVEFIRSFHTFDGGPRRRIWVQEVGAPQVNFYHQQVIPPEYSAEFVEATVLSLLSCEDLFGITWWCSHDIDPVLHRNRFNAPEYTLGLIDNAGHVKPGGLRLAGMIKEYRAGRLPGPLPRPTAVLGVPLGSQNTKTFDAVEAAGSPVAIVQPVHAADAGYLARRGITKLLR